MLKQQLEIYQMFGGYLHQDWLHEYIWDEGEKPHFKVAIEAYKEDCEDTPEIIHTSITELKELIDRNYDEEFLYQTVFRQLGIAVNPEAYGLTYQGFLQEVLKILTGNREAEISSSSKQKPDVPQSSSSQTTQDDLAYFKPHVYPPKPDHIIPTGIEGLLTVYFAKDYDELVEQYGKMRLITQIVAQ